jgi:hypothetical protein
MKTIISTLTCVLLLTTIARAQETTEKHQQQALFSSGSKISGWFVGMNNTSTQLNNHYANLPGFQAGVVMNHNFQVGFAGRSFSWNETYLRFDDVMDEPSYLNGGYGGLYLEASPGAHRLIHITFPLIIGGGGAVYLSHDRLPGHNNFPDWDFNRNILSSSPFFVVEPGANAEINLTGFIKIYAGYSYRWIHGLNLDNTRRNALNGSNLNIGLKFGKF